jgi:hypothetical protein
MCDQTTKEWAKAVQSEWILLQKNLPGQCILIFECSVLTLIKLSPL